MLENKDNKNDDNNLNPDFDFSSFKINEQDLQDDAKKLKRAFEPPVHSDILKLLLQELEPVNFNKYCGLPDEIPLTQKHYIVACIENILDTATRNNWALCKKNHSIFIYNGAFWKLLDREELQTFIGQAAELMGINEFDAKHYAFRDKLFKQFMSYAHLPTPQPPDETVFINLANGTFVISPEIQLLRPPQAADFLTHQLSFNYDPNATSPQFQKYLNYVLPNYKMQQILAEFIGYIFIKPSRLKLEKILMLYGPGANGKSVFFDIINALLGNENISNYSLENLTDSSGYYRAMIANKLLNYTSEMGGKLDTTKFKQLASGEPIDARLPYCPPHIISNYGRLLFNVNTLPKEIEQTAAYFRRLLIIAFNVTIPEEMQDKQLAQKIINTELPGILNWVLEGLNRLLEQGNFTECKEVQDELQSYKIKSDSVKLFIEDQEYISSVEARMPLQDLHAEYKNYCIRYEYKICTLNTFGERLRNAGFETDRVTKGVVVYITKKQSF